MWLCNSKINTVTDIRECMHNNQLIKNVKNVKKTRTFN